MKKPITIIVSLLSLASLSQKRKIILPDGYSLSLEKVEADKQGKYLYSLSEMGSGISPDGSRLAIVKDGPVYLFNILTV